MVFFWCFCFFFCPYIFATIIFCLCFFFVDNEKKLTTSTLVILPAVEHLETVLLLGDMHVLPLTHGCTASRIHLSLDFILLVTDHTVFLPISKNWHVHRFKLIWVNWHGCRTHRGLVNVFRKTTNLPDNLFSEMG